MLYSSCGKEAIRMHFHNFPFARNFSDFSRSCDRSCWAIQVGRENKRRYCGLFHANLLFANLSNTLHIWVIFCKFLRELYLFIYSSDYRKAAKVLARKTAKQLCCCFISTVSVLPNQSFAIKSTKIKTVSNSVVTMAPKRTF